MTDKIENHTKNQEAAKGSDSLNLVSIIKCSNDIVNGVSSFIKNSINDDGTLNIPPIFKDGTKVNPGDHPGPTPVPVHSPVPVVPHYHHGSLNSSTAVPAGQYDHYSDRPNLQQFVGDSMPPNLFYSNADHLTHKDPGVPGSGFTDSGVGMPPRADARPKPGDSGAAEGTATAAAAATAAATAAAATAALWGGHFSVDVTGNISHKDILDSNSHPPIPANAKSSDLAVQAGLTAAIAGAIAGGEVMGKAAVAGSAAALAAGAAAGRVAYEALHPKTPDKK